MPLAGGTHIVAATWKKLNADDDTAFRTLVIRAEDNAAGNIEISHDGANTSFYLKTDESLTFANSGTVTPQEVYLKGTAADKVYYIGVPA